MEENHNPLRFKVFYALKYPGFVKRIEWVLDVCYLLQVKLV
jgi:hypothetical protein